MKRIMLLIFVIILISPVPSSAEKMFVAVLDLEPKGVSRILAGAVTDVIRSEMVKTGLYTIIERTRMNEILKEQEFQASGCTDQACAVQIGKLLSAKKVLLGEINKIGQAYMITVRIVDVEKGTSEFAANEKAESEDKLDVAAKTITISLSQNIVEGNKEAFELFEKKVPTGLSVYYMYYTPSKAPFKDYYSSLMGGGLDYNYKLSYYLAIAGGVYYVKGDNDSGKLTVSLNSYSIGGRAGIPFYGFMYPYIGVAGRVTLFKQSGLGNSSSFTGYGGDASFGCAFIVWRTLSLWADYSMSMVKLNDKGNTDISGNAIRAGVMYGF